MAPTVFVSIEVNVAVVFDNNLYEQWIAEGSQSLPERSLKDAKSLLRVYEEPKLDDALLDDAINGALLAYIDRREREIPAKDSLTISISSFNQNARAVPQKR